MLNEIYSLYEEKCNKYNKQGIEVSDELGDVLLREAIDEVIFADYINNGRMIRV